MLLFLLLLKMNTDNITNIIKSCNLALDKLIGATQEERINTKRRYNQKQIYNYLEVPERCFKSTTKKKVVKQYDPIIKDLLQVNKNISELNKKPSYIKNYVVRCEF